MRRRAQLVATYRLRRVRTRHNFAPPLRLREPTALAEPLDRKRRGIGERLFAGHHLREQTARHGAEREPVMLVAEVEPQALMARRPADHRQHVR